MIGETIHNYVITAKIGEGGMGTVYLADDKLLDRQVAIKVLHPRLVQDEILMERFKNEAKTLARLNHPNITTLYSLIPHGPSLCMVMEYVDGLNLEDYLRKYGALPPGLAANIGCQVLDGLQYAHEKNIVHRDIKPANLVITSEGKVKIMDFGIARVMGSSRATRVGSAIGTLEYMSPEQVRSEEATPRSDIYALGIVLYEMLSGQTPFKSDSEYNLMQAQINQKPASLRTSVPRIPDAVNQTVLKALEKDPAKRFADAPAFRQALAASVTGSFLTPAEFEAQRVVPATRQMAAPTVLDKPTAQQSFAPTPAPSSARKWSESILDDGNTAKKVFFAAAAVVVILLLLDWVCSRKPAGQPIADPGNKNDIPITPLPPNNTVTPTVDTVANRESETIDESAATEHGPNQPAPNNNTKDPPKKPEKPGASKPPTGQPQPTNPPSNSPPPKPQMPEQEVVAPVSPTQAPPKQELLPQPVRKPHTVKIDANQKISFAPKASLSSERLQVGQEVELETTHPLVCINKDCNGIEIIKKGATVKGKVTEINPKKRTYSDFRVEIKSVQTVDENVTLGFYDKPIILIRSKDNYATWYKTEIKEAEVQKYKKISIRY